MTEVPGALRTLLETGWALARKSSSATVALARVDAIVDDDALPAEIRAPVRREIDAAVARASTPLDARTVEKVLKDAWDEAPDRVLDELDPTPLAVRPGAQVHAAVHEGERVVVKVRRPGLASAARNDVSLLDALSMPLRAAFPALDAGAVLRGVRERVLDELDLEHEASVQRQVARALRGVDGVVVPRAVSNLCTPDVLVAERLDGPTLAGSRAPDPEALAATLLHAGRAVAQAGLVMADPKPGHVVLMPDERIGLLGTGLAAPIDRARFALALDALRALRADDAAAFARAVGPAGMALLPDDAAGDAHALIRELGADLLGGPVRLDNARLARDAERTLARLPELLRLGAVVTPRPDDLWAARALGQLAALLGRLEATHDWPTLALGD